MATTRKSSPLLTFAQCAVGSTSRVWFVAEEEDDSRVLQLRGGKWSVRTPDWAVSSICGREYGADRFEVLALGIDGELLIGVPGGFSESHIDPQGENRGRGILRDIRMVGEDVFVAGMSRQVYRRQGGTWRHVSGTIQPPPGQAKGFNSIDGRAPDAVFAVGYDGEVWYYDGQLWKQLDSPTSVVLHRVISLPSGHAVMCGAAGVLLQATPAGIATVRNDATTDNLYGLAHFRGKVYVSSLTALYWIGPSGLEPVDTGLDGPLTFGSLDASAKELWSAGANHLLTTQDGAAWSLVDCPV